MYAVENFPSTMPFEAYTGFPVGRLVGQFGTLFDQITAAVILLVTLGSGDESTAMRVMLYMAPVFGSLVAIPTYLIARRFVDRLAALAAVVFLALVPGSFLNYTLVGFYDHHAAEVLFQSLAVFAFLVAFGLAAREKPVWELVVDRDRDALRRPVAFSALAGVAAALYMYAWQPGIIVVAFTGIFLVVKITSDVVHGDSPEPVAFVGAVSMTVTGLLMLIPLEEFSFGVTGYTLTQVVLPIATGLGSVLIAYLAREWEARDLDPIQYPAAVLGLVLASVGALAVVLPSAYGTITTNVMRTVAFGAGAETRTIGEAQPFLGRGGVAANIIPEYGFLFFTALATALILLGAPLVRSDDTNDTIYAVGSLAVVGSVLLLPEAYGAVGGLIGVEWQLIGLLLATAAFVGATYRCRYETETLYVLVWAGFMTATAFTQQRFNIYLAVPVVILNGVFLAMALDLLDLDDVALPNLADEIKGWQVLGALAVVLVLVAPLLFAVTPVWAAGADNGPGAVTQWDGTMEWMNDETPTPGEFEGHDDGMEYYDTYERPEDGDYDYAEGAYGVMSWWDYGHWITTQAERVPYANPFQQHATLAANYLLAPGEEAAHEVVGRESDEGGELRYVMVDWQMVNPTSKFGAPVVFYDEENVSRDDFLTTMWQPTENGARPAFQIRDQRYYESMMVRLYEYHGSAKEPQPVVVDWENQEYRTRDGGSITVQQLPAGDQPPVRTFDNMTAARSYVEEDGTAQVGGVGPHPSERVEALRHYRLVKAAERPSTRTIIQRAQLAMRTGLSQDFLSGTTPAWVKTFERVPGATIQGSGAEPGSEVVAVVEMEVPATNGTFTYTQYTEADENGEFEFVVPYSTTGYDEFGPENGYTNVSVRATGEYRIFDEGEIADDGSVEQNRTTVDVHEAKVVGADEEPVQVELEPIESGSDGTENSSRVGSLDGTARPVLDADGGATGVTIGSRSGDVAGERPVADAAARPGSAPDPTIGA